MVAFLGKRLKFARALKSRPYAMFWLGQTISNLGDGIFNIALAWQVLLMTQSGTAMGVVLIASMIPRLVFVLIGEVAADRLPRRMIILWSDGEALGGILTDRVGPAFVFIFFGLFNLVNVLIPLLVREVRELE